MACFFASFQSTFPFPQPSSWEDSALYFTKPAPSLTTNYHQDTDLFSCHVLGSSYMREKSFQITLLRSDGEACYQWEKGMLHTHWSLLSLMSDLTNEPFCLVHLRPAFSSHTEPMSSQNYICVITWVWYSATLINHIRHINEKSLKAIIYSFSW